MTDAALSQDSVAKKAVFPRMVEVHKPLMAAYQAAPERAWVTDHAQTIGVVDPRDPLRGRVALGPGREGQLDIALHTAVGGDSALPVPGDLLAAALATCLDSTVRVVANRFQIELTELRVAVDAEVDVRGTLMVDPKVPVGFQRMQVRLHLRAAPGTNARKLELLPQVAEHCCVVLQTLRAAVDISVHVDVGEAPAS
ncbi:MAG: OsmC family protein [Myxococcales bacterium]|nr:OsmC family protein [Myxococcales bacterium]